MNTMITDAAVASIAAFLKDRDEALTPDDVSDVERAESARMILELATVKESLTVQPSPAGQGELERFKAWWKGENYNSGALNSWNGTGYNNVAVNAAWARWQAAPPAPHAAPKVDVEDVLGKALDMAKAGAGAVGLVEWITEQLIKEEE